MTQSSSDSHPRSGSEQAADAARLEEFIRDLGSGEDSPNGLLREHLEAARSYLLGSMPSEYRFNLKLAEEALPGVKDKELKQRIDGFLRNQHPTSAEPAGSFQNKGHRGA
jgi:hypothetical protein